MKPRPALTVLQLDTDFPRVPGDVGCPETYLDPPQIIRIPGATVGQVVSDDPASIPIAPFEAALERANGEVVATSCGFLAYWQDHLAARSARPFVSSALTLLPQLCQSQEAHRILTVTFDAQKLNGAHLGPFQTDVLGLEPQMHLRQVISGGLLSLDTGLAERELCALVASARQAHHRHILFECTNLPPYKRAVSAACGLPVSDILTAIERARQGTVSPAHL